MTATTDDPVRGGEEQKASAPSGNTITGNASESVQAGVVNTINYYRAQDKVDLFARQVNVS
jgi:hypothetical protein